VVPGARAHAYRVRARQVLGGELRCEVDAVGGVDGAEGDVVAVNRAGDRALTETGRAADRDRAAQRVAGALELDLHRPGWAVDAGPGSFPGAFEDLGRRGLLAGASRQRQH